VAAEEGDLVEPGGKVRLFVEQPIAAGTPVTLDDGQAHYLRHVMRAPAATANGARCWLSRHGAAPRRPRSVRPGRKAHPAICGSASRR